jgi:spore coat polysaccharide biosynthesis protein SpsF
MMKTVIITQARMTSTRLPGKVLKEVRGKSLLAYQIERLRRIPGIDEIIVATTENTSDDVLVRYCEKLSVTTYRGPEHDVLARYFGAAETARADVVVRVTSDCPLIDPDVSKNVIQYYLENIAGFDYVSNTLKRTYPRGLDTEVFTFGALKTAHLEATQTYEREHVTPFIYNHPVRFRIGQVTDSVDRNSQRWTVDTPEDFEFVRRILETVYPDKPDFSKDDVFKALEFHPDWLNINGHILQKKLGE